jgi:hypothetical protein
VGTVVLCMCGVLLVLLVLLVGEGESGIAAGGTASLPGGGGIAAGTAHIRHHCLAALLPASGIAAEESVRAQDCFFNTLGHFDCDPACAHIYCSVHTRPGKWQILWCPGGRAVAQRMPAWPDRVPQDGRKR